MHPDAEFVIHCGDVEGGEDDIRCSVKCPLYLVAGNNDYFCALPRDLEKQLFGHRVFITRDCDIAFFGHTHRPEVSYGNGCYIVNPGSLSYPRQEGRKPSFCIWEVDDKGQDHFTIGYLNDGMM